MLDKTNGFAFDKVNVGDGRLLLKMIAAGSVSAAFFDPQYRAMIEKQGYGDLDSKTSKMARSNSLPAMPEWLIKNMIIDIERALKPSGHLFLWVDKFMLVEGVGLYLGLTDLQPVDMLTWDKVSMGMGYRSRRVSEYLVVLQKPPKRARDVWTDRGIKDVWSEVVPGRGKRHPHAKPKGLIERLIRSVTKEGELVIDPCAGSFATMDAAKAAGRIFLGCDLIDPKSYLDRKQP